MRTSRRSGLALVPMIVAELEVCHSRAIAPTRRISLGRRNLPVSPSPGAGGLLLAGVVAHTAPRVEPELREALYLLIEQLADGQRVVQPRVRHRFQTDRIGLLASVHKLVGVDGRLEFEFAEETSLPVQQALGAVYAASSLPDECRPAVFEAIMSALVWYGEVNQRFISQVMGGRVASLVELTSWNDPVSWAFEMLGLDPAAEDATSKRVVQRRFRSLVRDAHPDHGGLDDDAAKRIEDLTEARRILLKS